MKWRGLSRTQTVLEYPLATGVSLWGLVIGVLVLYGLTPSHTISRLEPWQATAWAISLLVGSVTTLWGLFVSRKVLTVARGLYLHTIVITVFWLSIIIAVGWIDGGAVASFFAVIALAIAREGINLRRRGGVQ